MAKASALIPGMEVRIMAGPYQDHTARVIDPTPIPDGGDDRSGPENQRKVLVALTEVFGADDQPQQVYILPRLLDPRRMQVVAGDNSVTLPVMQQAALTHIDGGALHEPEPITDPMDPALDRFRPDPSVVKRYISRMVPGGYSDIDFLLAQRDQRDANGYSRNVALVGETQSGKTMLVQVLAVVAAERDGMPKPYPVFTLSGSSGVTNYDIFGQTSAVIIDGKETLVWMEGLAAMAAKCGGFLYLDEWNAVSPSQAVALHPLMDDRRQFINTQKAVPDGHGGFSPEVVEANPLLWIISTINPGYKGTQTMAEATSNRFTWLSWDYDEATERALIPSKTVRLMGLRLREMGFHRVISVPVGTSVLQRFNKDCAEYGVDNAMWSLESLFPPAERSRVRAAIEDGGTYDLLKEEYPEPQFKPAVRTTVDEDDEAEAPALGNTWG